MGKKVARREKRDSLDADRWTSVIFGERLKEIRDNLRWQDISDSFGRD